MPKDYKQKSHEDPRISVNKLSEYLSTNKAARRERILREAKFPPTFQTIRYDPTREIVSRFLAGAIPNTQALQTAIADYSDVAAKDDFEERNKKSNLEALGYFVKLAPTLDFGDAQISLGAHAPPKLTVNDVAISVRPDLILSASKKGATCRGAIKLNISKGAVHTKDSADYAGTLVLRGRGVQLFRGGRPEAEGRSRPMERDEFRKTSHPVTEDHSTPSQGEQRREGEA